MIRTYYTLEDLIIHYFSEWPIRLDLASDIIIQDGGVRSTYLKLLALAFGGESFDLTNSPLATNEANSLFCRYIAPLYKDAYVGYADNAQTGDDVKVYQDFFRKFSTLLNNNADKYIKMISIFEAEKNKLMDDVTSYTESKFNDTPQANNAGAYDWSDDNHLTNVSRNTTSSQVATKMARIDELDRLITNYYKKWLKDFKSIFLYGGI